MNNYPNTMLTEKEKIFCEEYLTDMDATKAAMRAGYSEDSAKSTGYILKQRPGVMAYINHLLDMRSLRLRITAEQVLLELAKIAFSEAESPQTGPQTPEGGLKANESGTEAPSGAGRDETEGGIERQTTEGRLNIETNDLEEAPGEAPVRPEPRFAKATVYRVTEVDPVTGRRCVMYFSLPAKIAALKLLGLHLGLFGDKKGLPKRMKVILPRTDDYVPMDQRAA